jgi:hypothetical protein
VRTPVLAAFLEREDLLTRGKLRFVPIESNEETEGRWREEGETGVEMGRWMTEWRRGGGKVRGDPELAPSSAMDEMELSPSRGVMLDAEAVPGAVKDRRFEVAVLPDRCLVLWTEAALEKLSNVPSEPGLMSSGLSGDFIDRRSRAVANVPTVDTDALLFVLLRKRDRGGPRSKSLSFVPFTAGPLVVSTDSSDVKLPTLPRRASRWLIVPMALCRKKCS